MRRLALAWVFGRAATWVSGVAHWLHRRAVLLAPGAASQTPAPVVLDAQILSLAAVRGLTLGIPQLAAQSAQIAVFTFVPHAGGAEELGLASTFAEGPELQAKMRRWLERTAPVVAQIPMARYTVTGAEIH